jgi:hypothetical protein
MTKIVNYVEQNYQSKKAIWKKPELILIARDFPEENVLKSCKGPLINGPDFTHGNCKPGYGGGEGAGSACHQIGRS